MAVAEVTFTVHPRPTSDEPPPDDGHAAAVAPDSKRASEAPENVSHHKDTLLGDLMFLIRYLFGRY